MRKMKKIMLLVLLILLGLMLWTNGKVYAEGVTAEKIVTSTNGSIDYVIKGLSLEDGASYQWAIEKSKDATITNWYDVTAPEYQTGTVRISILATNENQLAILKSIDTAYVTIKKVGAKTNVLNSYQVDLTLPLLRAFTNIMKSSCYDRNSPNNPAFEINTIYGIPAGNLSYKWEKITDSNIVNNYIDNNHDLSGLKLKGKESFPSLSDTSWKSVHFKYSKIEREIGEILNGELPVEDGLYYLWLRGSDSTTKTIYGQAVLEVGEVKKITTNNSETNGNSSTTQKPDNSSNGNQSNTITATDKTQVNTSNSSNQSQKPTANNLTDKKTNSISNGSQVSNVVTTSPKVDSTTATKILPKTGTSIAIIGMLLFVIALGIGRLVKIHIYKDVK